MAVIECDPAVKAEVLSVAKSAVVSWIVPVPIIVVPFMNVTVPVANDGDRVAVNVTTEPYVDGLPDDVSVTLVAVLFTVCVSAGDEVLPL
jgi:hypothetical protein